MQDSSLLLKKRTLKCRVNKSERSASTREEGSEEKGGHVNVEGWVHM